MFDETAAIAALRADLPPWAGLAPLVLIVSSALIAATAAHLAVSIALLAHRGVDASAHWTERARRGWPARVVASGAPFFAGLVLGAGTAASIGPLSIVPAHLVGLLAGLAAFCAAYPQLGRVDRVVLDRRVRLRDRVAVQLFVFLVMTPHFLIVIFAALLMPADAAPAAVTAALVLALLVAFTMGAGLWIAHLLRLIRPADPRLMERVDACAEKVGVRPRRVWVVCGPMANAFAFPRTGDLAFTEALVESLSDDELAGVIAHELGHLGEPRSVVLARSIGAVALFPITLAKPVYLASARGGHVSLALLACFALFLSAVILSRIVRRLARDMEVRADAIAHSHDADSGAYARALERIYELNLAPAVTAAKQAVHSHLYDRLVAAGLAPSYPRPAAPPRRAQNVAMIVLIVLSGLGSLAPKMAGLFGMNAEQELAFNGGSIEAITDVGYARWDAGDLQGALPYYRAAAAIDTSGYSAAQLSELLAGLGRCDEAMAAVELGDARAASDEREYVERCRAEVTAICSTPLRDPNQF